MLNATKRQKRKLKKALRERNFKYLLKAAAFHLRLSSFFTLDRGEYRMKVFYVPFAFWLWTEVARERSDEKFYKNFLREGDTVADAGANIGMATLLCARRVGALGSVYSFEPHKRTFKHLITNIKLNNLKNVTAFNIGFSNKKEKVFFTDEYVTDINHVDVAGSASVLLSTLDEELKNVHEITLLKIDVEGYELFALEGGVETLTKTKVVYFESSKFSFARYGYELKDILSFLENQGFKTVSLSESFVLKDIEEAYITSSGYENLIAVREKDVDWLQARLLNK
jgi:FkbM family methyltransferase